MVRTKNTSHTLGSKKKLLTTLKLIIPAEAYILNLVSAGTPDVHSARHHITSKWPVCAECKVEIWNQKNHINPIHQQKDGQNLNTYIYIIPTHTYNCNSLYTFWYFIHKRRINVLVDIKSLSSSTIMSTWCNRSPESNVYHLYKVKKLPSVLYDMKSY